MLQTASKAEQKLAPASTLEEVMEDVRALLPAIRSRAEAS